MTWFGVVRYTPGDLPGTASHDANATFDGWYAERETALAIYQQWCNENPNANVALVWREAIRRG